MDNATKTKWILASVLLCTSLNASATILRNKKSSTESSATLRQPLVKGFVCYFETETSKRTIEIAGYNETTKSLPKRYENLIWPGQVASLDKDTAAPGPIYDLVTFQVGASGFAGNVVQIEAQGETQALTIRFVTGASAGPNGQLTVLKGRKVVAHGPVQCSLVK